MTMAEPIRSPDRDYTLPPGRQLWAVPWVEKDLRQHPSHVGVFLCVPDDGWITVRELREQYRCGHRVAGQALKALVQCGLVAKGATDSAGRRLYRKTPLGLVATRAWRGCAGRDCSDDEREMVYQSFFGLSAKGAP